MTSVTFHWNYRFKSVHHSQIPKLTWEKRRKVTLRTSFRVWVSASHCTCWHFKWYCYELVLTLSIEANRMPFWQPLHHPSGSVEFIIFTISWHRLAFDGFLNISVVNGPKLYRFSRSSYNIRRKQYSVIHHGLVTIGQQYLFGISHVIQAACKANYIKQEVDGGSNFTHSATL